MRALFLTILLSAVLSTATYAVDTNDTPPPAAPSLGSVDLTAARAAVKAKSWTEAVALLSDITARVSNADAFNLLAFSLRNQGHHDAAFTYYFKALDLDPNHKGAREYLGELYVKTGNMDKAREQLAILERLCPSGCEEREDLEAAIRAGAPAR